MSNTAKNWAFRQDLKPVPKLVLVVLADTANDQGICWPSIATLADKTGVTRRTVQRAIQLLIRRELITARKRYRSDGSCSSNLYRLLLGRGDKLSPTPGSSDSTSRHTCQDPPDAGVVPGTTIRTNKESPLLPVPKPERPDRGGGEIFDLFFPKDLLPTEQSQAQAMVAVLKAPINQQVLDEWAGIIAAGSIRSSVLGCLRVLVQCAQQGTFTPERAMRVAQARKTQQRVAAIKAAEPELVPIDENNALVRRIMSI